MRVAWVCLVVLGLGCGGSGDGGGGDRTAPDGLPNGTGAGGSNASAGNPPANSGAGNDGFGNGMSNTPTAMQGAMLRDGGINETTNPDDVKCGGTKFTPKITMTLIPGNILLVADKSWSMNDPFPATGVQKGQAAREAVANAIGPLMNKVNVATVFFPDAAGCSDIDCGCNVPPFSSTPPQIAFTPGPMFLPTWNSSYSPVMGGRTPLSEALQAADKGLTDNLPKLMGTTVVVVVTDGEPNCVVDQLAVNDKVGVLTPLPMRWLGMGVKTYVIGLPGADEPDAVTILDSVANAGGTTKHIPATDPTTVQTELAKIISESVTSNFETCTIPLEKKPPNPDDVNLVVTMNGMDLAVDRDLGDAGGWAMDQDSTNIVLQGRLCDAAKHGDYSNITVVFGCVDVPPLPPPPPVM
jgi:hypothetical protein